MLNYVKKVSCKSDESKKTPSLLGHVPQRLSGHYVKINVFIFTPLYAYFSIFSIDILECQGENMKIKWKEE